MIEIEGQTKTHWLKLPRNALTSLAAAATLAVMVTPFAAKAQDPAAGEDVFRKCRACHQVGATARNGVGPVQNGLIGRKAGTYDGYAYSELNKAAGAAGLVWTEENVFAYLADPGAFLKKFLTDAGKADQAAGNTKMVFKLADEQERKDVIAYLKSLK
jgi:cytochrome c